MTLEKQLAELTTAVNDLTAVLQTSLQASAKAMPAQILTAEEAEKAAEEFKEAQTKKAPAKAPAKKAEPKPEPAKQEPKAEEAPAEEENGVSFDEVRTATRELGITRDRETVVALLADFGVGKASELEPAKYAEYVARARAAMAENDDLSE